MDADFVIGLQNLGLTCYLNSLLQAMASCRYFVEWLNSQQNQGQVASATKELLNGKYTDALMVVVWFAYSKFTLIPVLCGKSTSLSEEYFVSPVEVVTALSQNGWRITNSQQDVHELLCNFVTILEEEAHKSCVDVRSIRYSFETSSFLKIVKLSQFVALFSWWWRSTLSVPSTRMLKSPLYPVLLILLVMIPIIVQTEMGLQPAVFVTLMSVTHLDRKYRTYLIVTFRLAPRAVEWSSRTFLFRRRSGKRKKHVGHLKPYVAHDLNQSPRPSPFRGYLTNKLECMECNYKVRTLHAQRLFCNTARFNCIFSIVSITIR